MVCNARVCSWLNKVLEQWWGRTKSQDQNFVALRSTQMIGSAGKCPERSALLGARVLVQGMCWRAVGYGIDRLKAAAHRIDEKRHKHFDRTRALYYFAELDRSADQVGR
jgi:hypothetical protein